MKISDLMSEGVIDNFRDMKVGFDAPGKIFQKSKSEPKQSSDNRKSTPFDTVDPNEFKQILSVILNKQELSARQQQVIKNLYNNL